jgi:prepilin-type processing-associated H-X9-DG protein
MMAQSKPRQSSPAFTLVELLVVLGIIVVLIGILLPSLSRSRQAANSVVCQSNLRQIGLAMLIYADQQNGFLFPTDMGYDAEHVIPYPDTGAPGTMHNVWPVIEFGVWNPPVMICPADQQPLEQHSYVVNSHMAYWNVKYSSVLPNQIPPSNIVLMGEKVTLVGDYYMEYGDFDRVVEKYRHGAQLGSNYLMLDLHVTTELPAAAEAALDPWDFAAGTTAPTAPNGGSGY